MPNKKEDSPEVLPDLPPLESIDLKLPEVEKETPNVFSNYEKHNLPVFPDSANDEGFSQAAIKDAISHEQNLALPKLPDLPENPKDDQGPQTHEMEEWEPPEHPMTIEEGEGLPPLPKARSLASPNIGRKTRDIFVKIDKFNLARRTLAEAQDKLEEITNVLKRIRETKLREEQELTLWEKSMMNAKAQIQDVTNNIFEKVD